MAAAEVGYWIHGRHDTHVMCTPITHMSVPHCLVLGAALHPVQHQGAGGSQSQLSLTDLAITLFMRLWDLLADPTIMGTSDRPAGWLPLKSTYLEWSRQCITDMVTAVQEALAAAGSTTTQSAGAPATHEQPVSVPATGQLDGVPGGSQNQGNSTSSGSGSGSSSSRDDQSTGNGSQVALQGQGCAGMVSKAWPKA
jgi:hypothetical protein